MITQHESSGKAADLPEPESDDNGERAAHWHRLIQQTGAGILEMACRAGEALNEQKDICREMGLNFKGWCAEHLPFSHKTATNYMRIADRWQLLQEVQRASPPEEPLSIREAIRLIAEAEFEQRPEVTESGAVDVAKWHHNKFIKTGFNRNSRRLDDALEALRPAINEVPSWPREELARKLYRYADEVLGLPADDRERPTAEVRDKFLPDAKADPFGVAMQSARAWMEWATEKLRDPTFPVWKQMEIADQAEELERQFSDLSHRLELAGVMPGEGVRL